MYTKFFFLSLFILSTISLNAQSTFLGKPIKSISLSISHDRDLLSSMDNAYFTDAMKSKSDNSVLTEKFSDAQVESMVCENPALNLNIVLELPKNLEWSVGLNAIISRYDALSYKSIIDSDWGFNYANFSTTADEYGVETALIKRISLSANRNKLGNSPINLYLGAGTNIGAIVNNKLYAYGSDESMVESFSYTNSSQLRSEVASNTQEPLYSSSIFYNDFNEEVKLNSGFSQRVYGQLGIGFTIARRVELGLQGKYGIGYRVIKGADTKKTTLESIGFSMKWLLQ